MISAFNTLNKEAYVYLEVEKIRSSVLKASIEGTLATEVDIFTFSCNTPGNGSKFNAESAAALFSVHSYARKHGWILVERPGGVASVQPKEMQPAAGSQQASLDREAEDLHVQERVMAEHPRDFDQEPASDDDDDDDAGSVQIPEGHCGESLKRPAEVSVSPPAKRYHHGEANAKLKLNALETSMAKDAEIINVLKTSMAKDAEIISALKTSMAKDAEINALKTSMAAKDIEAKDSELSKAIDTKDTALSAAADAKKHAQQVEADKNNEIRALMQKLDAATAEINRRKTIEETVQVVNAVMNESVVAVRTLAVELCKDNAEKMEVRDEAMAKRMEVRDEAMAKRMDSVQTTVQEVKVSHQQHAEKEAECQELRTKNASDAAKRGHITRKNGKALKALAVAERELQKRDDQGQLVRQVLQATSEQRQVDYFVKFKEHINSKLVAVAPKTNRRRDLLAPDFPDEAYRRYYDYCISLGLDDIENVLRVDGSPNDHRFYLQLCAGPIMREDIFVETQDVKLKIIKALCKRLRIKNTSQLLEYAPTPNAFDLPEVMCLVSLVPVGSLTCFTQVAFWKLEDFKKENVYKTPFNWYVTNKLRSTRFIELGIEDLNLSREDCFRYYTFMHMGGMRDMAGVETTMENLQMIQGPFYSKQTVEEMEAPLVSMINDLRRRLNAKASGRDFIADIEEAVVYRVSLGARKNHRVQREGNRKNRFTTTKGGRS